MNGRRVLAALLLALLLIGCSRQATPTGPAKPETDPHSWPASPDTGGEKWPQLSRLTYQTREAAAAAATTALFADGGARWLDVARMACQIQPYSQFRTLTTRTLDEPLNLVSPTLSVLLKDLPQPKDGLEAWEAVTTGIGQPSLTGEPRFAYGLLWQTPGVQYVRAVSLALILRQQSSSWCLEFPYYARLHTDQDLPRVRDDFQAGAVVSVRPGRS